MRLRITKLFRFNAEDRVCDVGEVIIGREQGQVRKISGCIGGKTHDGSHIVDVRGSGKLEITIAPDTTLHMQPWE